MSNSAVMSILVFGTISLVLGAFGAWIISKYASKLGLIDKPSARSSHVRATPKGGGFGILLTIFILGPFLGMPWVLWIPSVAVSAVSFWGDRINLNQKKRLAFQFFCTFVFLSLIWSQVQELTQAQLILSLLILLVLAVFSVGTANFYNFMDGINGIAGLTGIIGFAGVAFYPVMVQGDSFGVLSMIDICVALACLGFIPFNLPKARVFMGDVGSILLGFLFAASVILMSKTLLDFLCLIGLLFPFYADELTTMIIRLKAGESLLCAHRRHIYQILVNQMKYPHWKISSLYAVVQLCFAGCVLFLRNYGLAVVLGWFAISFCGVFVLGKYIRKWEFSANAISAK
jgi:Fuc2NAc and GlcNAc transferase